MKRVLIVTYYWPPAGGAGVQRWLKMSKYLSDYGWQPVIYTPENSESPAEDITLLEEIRNDLEIIRRPIWEPYSFYKRFLGRKRDDSINTGFLQEEKPPTIREKISVWIRGNLFIPDARMFWIKPSVKFLKGYLRQNPVDAIITTGPPHSMHMIGLGLKKALNIAWVADFRDPWTKIDFYHRLRLTFLADRKHRRMEREVLTSADEVITIGWSSREDFISLGAKDPIVITNGYDEEDFVAIGDYDHSEFSITHVGLMNDDRNPECLWEALKEICSEDKMFRESLKIKLIGKVDFTVIKSLEKYQLTDFTERISYLPHKEAIKHMTASGVLLLSINNTPDAKGIVTGKLFEYMAVQRPILCISPVEGDSARIIMESAAGCCAGFPGSGSVKSEVLRLFELYKQRALYLHNPDATNYTRKGQAKQVAHILDSLGRR